MHDNLGQAELLYLLTYNPLMTYSHILAYSHKLKIMVTSTERKEKRNKGGALLSMMVGLVGMIDKAVSKSAQIEFPYPKRYSIIETDSVSELGYQIRIY